MSTVPAVAAAVPEPNLNWLVVVLGASALAAILSRLHGRLVLPTVVLELALGILIGPEVLDWADADAYVTFLSRLGLAMLFFMAGLEVVEKKVPRASCNEGRWDGSSRSRSGWWRATPPTRSA